MLLTNAFFCRIFAPAKQSECWYLAKASWDAGYMTHSRLRKPRAQGCAKERDIVLADVFFFNLSLSYQCKPVAATLRCGTPGRKQTNRTQTASDLWRIEFMAYCRYIYNISGKLSLIGQNSSMLKIHISDTLTTRILLFVEKNSNKYSYFITKLLRKSTICSIFAAIFNKYIYDWCFWYS